MQPRDPREWMHQDEFMLQLEGTSIKNPLVYEKITYPSHDWDNIPPVIPKFIIQLEKYMEGVTKLLKGQIELETVASLRSWAENSAQVIDERLIDAGVKRKTKSGSGAAPGSRRVRPSRCSRRHASPGCWLKKTVLVASETRSRAAETQAGCSANSRAAASRIAARTSLFSVVSCSILYTVR